MAIDLVVDDGVNIPAATLRALRTELGRMVRAAARTDGRADYEVAARFVDDKQMRVLNRDYRGKDKPTDVLAFAHREGPAAELHPDVLGDVVISVDTAKKQAKQGLHAELLHLASHGLCHLLGYDHNDDDEEHAMNTRAAALRAEAKRRGRIRAA
ncbi:MAG: rRNA maturation RNase YbeY [Myxococcota bacterium]|nr:rRNA maturation RNase YbeY [Myxococcota bacterium]